MYGLRFSLEKCVFYRWPSCSQHLSPQKRPHCCSGQHHAFGHDSLVQPKVWLQVKLWVPASGSCFVTFSAHTAPVTALAFLRHSAAVVSASLDGTVRAWDLLRYRNFRTMTSPTPVQFNSLAVDPAGEVSSPQDCLPCWMACKQIFTQTLSCTCTIYRPCRLQDLYRRAKWCLATVLPSLHSAMLA